LDACGPSLVHIQFQINGDLNGKNHAIYTESSRRKESSFTGKKFMYTCGKSSTKNRVYLQVIKS